MASHYYNSNYVMNLELFHFSSQFYRICW